MSLSKAAILRELKEKFGDVREIQATHVSGVLPYKETTIRHKIQTGTLGIRVRTVQSPNSSDPKHRKHYIKISDLADYLLSQEEAVAAAAVNGPKKLKRGRPTKAEQIVRREFLRIQMGRQQAAHGGV